MVLHNVYVLTKDGLPLFSKVFGSIEADEIQISGFVSAINNFLEQTVGQNLLEIKSVDYKFCFYKNDSENEDKVVFTVVCDHEDNTKELEAYGSAFVQLLEEIIKNYNKIDPLRKVIKSNMLSKDDVIDKLEEENLLKLTLCQAYDIPTSDGISEFYEKLKTRMEEGYSIGSLQDFLKKFKYSDDICNSFFNEFGKVQKLPSDKKNKEISKAMIDELGLLKREYHL